MEIVIRCAHTTSDFQSIYKLNYDTFVREIPQHPETPEHLLVDRFNDHNRYVMALRDEALVGMVCYSLTRPFSLDEKGCNIDHHLPPYTRLAEVRLLAVAPDYRKSSVTYKLLHRLCAELISTGVDMAVISGITNQIPLYLKLGFIPFGERVGKAGALFQPMYISLKNLRNDFKTN